MKNIKTIMLFSLIYICSSVSARFSGTAYDDSENRFVICESISTKIEADKMDRVIKRLSDQGASNHNLHFVKLRFGINGNRIYISDVRQENISFAGLLHRSTLERIKTSPIFANLANRGLNATRKFQDNFITDFFVISIDGYLKFFQIIPEFQTKSTSEKLIKKIEDRRQKIEKAKLMAQNEEDSRDVDQLAAEIEGLKNSGASSSTGRPKSKKSVKTGKSQTSENRSKENLEQVDTEAKAEETITKEEKALQFVAKRWGRDRVQEVEQKISIQNAVNLDELD